MSKIKTLDHAVNFDHRPDGSIIMSSGLELGPVAHNTDVWVQHWATEAPERVFMAERDGSDWVEITYGNLKQTVDAVAASLVSRGLHEGKTIAVLSGPSIDHAILMLAAHKIGAVIVPLAEQYSLIPDAWLRLTYAVELTQPDMVFAANHAAFADALALNIFDGIEKVSSSGGGGTTLFADLKSGSAGDAVTDASTKVGPDSIAKILFTSGSTSNPKGVPQTHGMLTVNQAQYLACLPFLGDKPPVILDWLPWNHVFAGNSNFYMALSNGGTLVLDAGKPVPALLDKTIQNIRERAGNLSFNVPAAFALLVDAMSKDEVLRRAYFADLDMIFYAGASLPTNVWQALEDMAVAETGSKPFMTSSWGMTETAPCALLNYQPGSRSGMIGVPVPGMEAKLVPVEPGRFDLRVRGSNIFKGYYKDAEKTAEAFDEEGFFLTGDAVRFADVDNPDRGVLFDGRLGEDFKLLTGTWVQAGTLRLTIMKELAGLVQDVVVTGQDRMDVGLLVFPAAGKIKSDAGLQDGVITDPTYSAALREKLRVLADSTKGSSNRIVRALVMVEPPSVKDAEVTAKGSLNINSILKQRANLLERLYDNEDPAVIRI